MKTNIFDYNIDESFISQHPRNRGESKLMVLNRVNGSTTIDDFANISDYLPKNSILILNNTKVFKARLFAVNEKGREIEVFVVNRLSDIKAKVLLRPRKKLKATSVLTFKDKTLTARFIDFENNIIEFSRPVCLDDYAQIGEVPLPAYIKRKAEGEDEIDYQTVYAKEMGSIAAPTAGFHFTSDILDKIQKEKNIQVVYVTHHIGYATFRPIKSENVEDHDMLEEFYTIDNETAKVINNAKKNGNKIIAVGTSSVRSTESSMQDDGSLKSETASTELFIYPGYKFKCMDHMITNFHLPASAPLMMVCALANKEQIHTAYQEAMENSFKFYSYGDAMLIV